MSSKDDTVTAYVDGKKHEGVRGGLDVKGADFVEVLLSHDRSKLWVNTGKGCLLRLYGARGMLQVSDQRYGMDHDVPWRVRELLWAARLHQLAELKLDPRIVEGLIGDVHLLNAGMRLWTLEGIMGRAEESCSEEEQTTDPSAD